jgi:dipeptidyl aminopeptidase/acylaminoacyl peptidase
MRKLLAILALTALAWTPAEAQSSKDKPVQPLRAFTVRADAPPPAELLAMDSEVERVHLSPSGRYVATIARVDSVTYIIVEDLQQPGKPSALELGDTRIYDFLWVTDDRVVYRIGGRDFDVDVKFRGIVISGAPQYIAMNRDFSGIVELLDRSVSVATDGRFIGVTTAGFGANRIVGDAQHIVLSDKNNGRLDLMKVNLATGKGTRVGEGVSNTLAWLVDRSGRPAMRLDTNRRGTELRVMTPQGAGSGARWTEAMRWRRDQTSGKVQEFYPLAPGPSPELYYVAGRPAGADRIGIHLYDITARSFVRELFTHPDVDVEGALFDPRTGAYAGAAYWSNMLDVRLADAALQKHYNGLKGYFGAEFNVQIAEMSDDQSVWLLRVSGPRDPGSFHIYETKAARNTALRSVNKLLADLKLAPAQLVSYSASDGLAIRGYLTLPPDLPQGAKPPLIAYPHGGPEVRDVGGFNPVVQFLATRGYAVFQPNFRGSAGYGYAFAQAGRRQFGRAMQTDINEGIDHLASKGLVDPDRVCILGESYGGYASLAGVTLYPERFRCAVSMAGLSDLYQMMRWEEDQEGYGSPAYKYWLEQIGDPGKDRAEMEKYSPIKMIDRIKAPILLLHGKRDSVVPIEQSEKMEQALLAAGRNVRMVRFEEGGHSFDSETLLTYLNELEAFFGQHLPVAKPPG